MATEASTKIDDGLDAALLRVRQHLEDRRGRDAAGVSITPLSGDASTRRYLRLTSGGESSVLCLYPEAFRPEELSFLSVHGLLAGMGLPVPAVQDVDGPRGVVVQEDLGDATLQTLVPPSTAATRALYREALRDLVILQRESVRSAYRAPCFEVAFDVEKLSWELHYFQKHFLEGLRGRDLSVEDRSILSEAFHRLADEIASWPRVLCHRDFHSRNLMSHRQRLHWIDFQDARMGPATYDLVSLLRDSYVELPEELVAELAEEFRAQAAVESRDEFQRQFELMSVQRNLKALGTFGYMATVRGNDVYLPYVPHTLRCARRNLLRHPELRPLQGVLARHVDELA